MPRRIVPPRNQAFAKAMRQEMTKAGLRLWLPLRKPGLPGLRFRRQTPIGPFIVDFFCPEHRLVVEIDGNQHGLPNRARQDKERDAWLREQGYLVIRFWNREVMTNLDGVCQAILALTETERNSTPPETRFARFDLPSRGRLGVASFKAEATVSPACPPRCRGGRR